MTRKETKARRALLDSATILLANNPGASFIEIAEAAGIGRATLYRHFPTREDLFRTLTLEAIAATDAAGTKITLKAGNARQALQLMFEAMIEIGDRYYFLTRLPELDDEEINAHLKRQNAELEQLVAWAQGEGVIADDIPTAWATAVVNGLIYAAWDVRGDDQTMTKEQVAALSMRTLEQGIGMRQRE